MIKNKCKRIISIIMLLVMMVATFSINVYAGSGMSRRIYTGDAGVCECICDEGSCGENVRYSFNSETDELTITGRGSISGKLPWFKFKDQVKSIIIEEGVENIPHCAFNGCTSLQEVTIPNSVTTIGCMAFDKCTKIIRNDE